MLLQIKSRSNIDPSLVVFGLLRQLTVSGRFPRYDLPIALGASSEEVRRILGWPTEVVREAQRRRILSESSVDAHLLPTTDNVTECYYSSGIVGTFDHDRLFEVALHSYGAYPGFVVYSGMIVTGTRLTDRKQTILSNLGSQQRSRPTLSKKASIPMCPQCSRPKAVTIGSSETTRYVLISWIKLRCLTADLIRRLRGPRDAVKMISVQK